MPSCKPAEMQALVAAICTMLPAALQEGRRAGSGLVAGSASGQCDGFRCNLSSSLGCSVLKGADSDVLQEFGAATDGHGHLPALPCLNSSVSMQAVSARGFHTPAFFSGDNKQSIICCLSASVRWLEIAREEQLLTLLGEPRASICLTALLTTKSGKVLGDANTA